MPLNASDIDRLFKKIRDYSRIESKGVEKTRKYAMEVEKEENPKAEKSRERLTERKGAWGSQASYRAPVRVCLATGHLIHDE